MIFQSTIERWKNYFRYLMNSMITMRLSIVFMQLEEFFKEIFGKKMLKLYIKEGMVIERYNDDFPFPSFLISGTGCENTPLHVVAALNSDEGKLVIITVYKPDSLKWTNQFSRRIK
jgi:hypothetical protein